MNQRRPARKVPVTEILGHDSPHLRDPGALVSDRSLTAQTGVSCRATAAPADIDAKRAAKVPPVQSVSTRPPGSAPPRRPYPVVYGNGISRRRHQGPGRSRSAYGQVRPRRPQASLSAQLLAAAALIRQKDTRDEMKRHESGEVNHVRNPPKPLTRRGDEPC